MMLHTCFDASTYREFCYDLVHDMTFIFLKLLNYILPLSRLQWANQNGITKT